MAKPLITELAASGPATEPLPAPTVELSALAEMVPDAQRRRAPPSLPALDEATLRRHFADLASPETPPAMVARAAGLPGLTRFHPRQRLETVQGLLEVAHEVGRALAGLTGLDRFSFQPPTPAAAEQAALLLARASFARTQPHRKEVVVADERPAAADAGLAVRRVPRLASGDLDVDALMDAVGPNTVAVVAGWLTPQGAFERNLAAAAEVAHAQGALLVVDATGLAALAGRTRLRETEADVCWLGLRELCPTATSGAIGVRTPLTEFLPSPLVGKTRSGYELDDELPGTIGPLALSPAHLTDVLAVYIHLRQLGPEGLRERADRLVLEASAASEGERPRLR